MKLTGPAVVLAAVLTGCTETPRPAEAPSAAPTSTPEPAADAVTPAPGTSPAGAASATEGKPHEEGSGERHREGGEARGEHDRDAGPGEGEDSGRELARTERFDEVRRGVRLVLAYDEGSRAFKGTVQNVTEHRIRRVRVEVHLSNGKELEPTAALDLAAGERREVTLTPATPGFQRWSAHAEVGTGEHGAEDRR